MLTESIRIVVRGIVVEEFDVGNQSRPRVERLKKVVTEQRILRHSSVQGGFKSVHLVETFTGVIALAKEILINV